MSDHYYSRTQNVESDPKNWDYILRGTRFRFKTDNGVFSKREVDFGSKLLIETFLTLVILLSIKFVIWLSCMTLFLVVLIWYYILITSNQTKINSN